MRATLAAAEAPGGLQITAPPDGTVVAPGATVSVTVVPETGVVPVELLLASRDAMQVSNNAPYQFSVVIPQNAVGPFSISALANDAAGTVYGASMTLQVTPTAALSRIEAIPANLWVNQLGNSGVLQVRGYYADNVIRDLTAAVTGTTYQSSNTGVVTVDADGRLTAQSNGTATVTATNGGVSAYTTVRVEAGTDLAISQTDSPDPISTDGFVTYTLTVQNLGTQRALDLRVSDTLPTGATLAQATGTGWVCNESGGVVSCLRDALDAGATSVISLEVEVPLPCGVITNQASVKASTHDDDVDNNVSIATTSCSVQTYTLTVAKAGTGSGTVTSTPEGIDCGATCSASFGGDTSVTLTATPAANSTFVRWSPDSCGSALTLTADTTCTATFNRINQPPVAKCRNATVTASNLCQAAADINDGSSDPEGGALTLSQSPAGPYGLGNTLVTLTATDTQGASSSCTATVTVTDATPPTLASVSASPSSLWPPNHKMVSVKVTATTSDNCTVAPVCTITSVTSNEPDNGLGDGDTANDIVVTGDLTVNLRAERSGTGTGRVYTVNGACTDTAGNSVPWSTAVTVPHDQGKK